MREFEALLRAAQLDPGVPQHLIILVQMKVLDGKCGYERGYQVSRIPPHTCKHTHT